MLLPRSAASTLPRWPIPYRRPATSRVPAYRLRSTACPVRGASMQESLSSSAASVPASAKAPAPATQNHPPAGRRPGSLPGLLKRRLPSPPSYTEKARSTDAQPSVAAAGPPQASPKEPASRAASPAAGAAHRPPPP